MTFLLEAVAILIALLLAVTLILDLFLFYRIWKSNNSGKKSIKEPQYFELKYIIDLSKTWELAWLLSLPSSDIPHISN